jgi:hypothetical protein
MSSNHYTLTVTYTVHATNQRRTCDITVDATSTADAIARVAELTQSPAYQNTTL